MQFGTQPCDVCGSTDFIEANTVGNLICAVCGNISVANAVMELDIDESLAMTITRGSIVRVSSQVEGAAALGDTRRKYAVDTRAADDFLKALCLINDHQAQVLSEALQDPSIATRFKEYQTKYLELLHSRVSEMGLICDADNIFLPAGLKPPSLEVVGDMLEARGLPRSMVLFKPREYISRLVSDQTNFQEPLPPQPGFKTALALMWAATRDFTARQFICFVIANVPYYSAVISAQLPQSLERSDYATDATLGLCKSRLRPERLPSPKELDAIRESLILAGLPVPRRDPAALLDRFLSRLHCGAECMRLAHKVLTTLGDTTLDRSVFSLIPPLTGRKRIFRELFIHRTEFTGDKVAREISRLEESYVGVWPLESTMAAVALLSWQFFETTIPEPLDTLLWLGTWKKQTPAEKAKLLGIADRDIFNNANPSFFRDLILEISQPTEDAFVTRLAEVKYKTTLHALPVWDEQSARPAFPTEYGRALDILASDIRNVGSSKPARDLHNATLTLRDWLLQS